MINSKKSGLAAVVLMMLVATAGRAEVIDKTDVIRRTPVHYKVVLPNNYDPSKTYPGVFALGGGSQTMSTVDGVLNRFFRAEAERRGYIVIAPAAPDDHLVLWIGQDVFPDFLKKMVSDYKIRDSNTNAKREPAFRIRPKNRLFRNYFSGRGVTSAGTIPNAHLIPSSIIF